MPKSLSTHSIGNIESLADAPIGVGGDSLLGNTFGVLTDHRSVEGDQRRQLSIQEYQVSSRSLPSSDSHADSDTDLLTGYGVKSIHSSDRGTESQATFSSKTALASASSTASRSSRAPSGLVNLMEVPLPPNQAQGTKQYIIQFKNSVTNISDQANRLVNRYQGQLSQVYDSSLKGFAAKLSTSALQALKQQSSIAAIYEDVPVKLGPSTAQPQQSQSNLKNRAIVQSTQSTPWGINRVGGTKDGTGKTVWIIDTGVDYKHPDLRVDTRRAKTFIGRSATDDNGHGTHVAGTIAALNNTIGVVGVAAGATVVPVKVLDKNGSGYLSDVIAGVDYVAKYAKAGEVVNMSLGGGYYQPLNDAVLRAAAKGIKFAIAAGNSAQDVATASPASTNGVNVFTVSAIDSTDTLASFSNFGAGIDYAAPGVGILSTWPGGTYTTLSGTSMATPHVAGLLLLGTPGVNGVVKGDRDTFNEGIAFGVV